VVSANAQRVGFEHPARTLPGKFANLVSVAQFRSEKGCFFMYRPAPGMFYSQGVGYIEREPVEQVCALASTIIAESPTIDAFHDWSEVVGYDTGARAAFTAWMLNNYRTVRRVRILARSKLVSMGVSAVDFAVNALGVTVDMRVYNMRSEFDEDFLQFLGG
jgi:hypothetical protein